MPARAILPKRALAEPTKLALAIQNALDMQAKNIQVDFGVTTQTWSHDVAFAVDAPTPWQRIIGTTDTIYAFVNDGTKAHTIAPRAGGRLAWSGPFRSKTLPRTIASGPGGTGGARTILPRGRAVQHPGTAARQFDQTIAQKWDRQIGALLQRAIDAAFGG